MTKEKIWLSSPHMGGTERKYIDDAFEKNWIAPLGPNVSGFEEDLEKYLFTNNSDSVNSAENLSGAVAALSSGTAALHLALVLIGVKPGDEVICQSMTFAASANPIVYLGATPVFVDSEEETLNLSPYHLEEAIKDRLSKGKNVKAIIAVHLYGMPYKIEEIQQISEKYDIPVIEDSAEALGSSYKGQKCGTFGEMGILSFNGNKIITTSGGGALVTKSKKIKEKTVFLATQARDEAPHYQHSEIGYNYRMSNICAGIGRGQMEVLDKHVGLRREMHLFYEEIFDKVEGIKVYSEPENSYFCNHWLTVVKMENGAKGTISRDRLRSHLENENIESRPVWKPMHLQPVFKDAPYYGEKVASAAFETGMCLPSSSNLEETDKQRIAGAINSFLQENK